MPTNPILKAIFIPCITGAVILVIVLQFLEPCKKLEALISALFGISCLTNFINAVFFKELNLRGEIYKGGMAIFFWMFNRLRCNFAFIFNTIVFRCFTGLF